MLFFNFFVKICSANSVHVMLRRKLTEQIASVPEKKQKIDSIIAQKVVDSQSKNSAKFRNFKCTTKNIAYIYNPLEYAFEPFTNYVRKYCNDTKKIIFMGMNPGPFGMCQTGIPFGDINNVKDWLQIHGSVNQPPNTCPERPIKGFDCEKVEISGSRLWGFFKQLCESPENFFKNSFVYNYCPLAFMKTNGANVTPNNLNTDDRKFLENICDEALNELIEILQPEIIVGVGKYSKDRAAKVAQNRAKVLYLIHPSPIIPNNQNWSEKAAAFLKTNNLTSHFTPTPEND